MASIVQKPDGSMALVNDRSGHDMIRTGGPQGSSMAAGDLSYSGISYIKQRVTISSAAGAAFSVANPVGTTLLAVHAYLKIDTAAATTTQTMDIGCATASGTSNDNLIDGVSLGATGVFDNITDKGTNGKSRQTWLPTGYITGTASGTPTSLVADLYIGYLVA